MPAANVGLTPLLGMSEVMMLFLNEDQLGGMRRDSAHAARTPPAEMLRDDGDEDDES
jgi:hypothetical protein